MCNQSRYLFIIFISLASWNVWAVHSELSQTGVVDNGSSSIIPAGLFGYHEIQKQGLSLFPQWLSVLERHLLDVNDAKSCQSTRFNQCHLKQWQRFLESIRSLPVAQQIRQVNKYANEKKYILDIENYGITDYWATPLEFLTDSGDCEDYAIIKMLSLKWLGYDVDTMRVVVVQDTNLRIPHAVMAIRSDDDILILDNQIEEVISHVDIFHYVPVYSVNENRWWMHVPE
ncbi:MAG: transglutaminase-like cysteine peptidase [Gammaproteobacteria bacterium]|nr:transglutaminase-like cysteine peptidase [Gammaproteobacteria bacterium]